MDATGLLLTSIVATQAVVLPVVVHLVLRHVARTSAERTGEIAKLTSDLARAHAETLEFLQKTAVVGGTPREFAQAKLDLEKEAYSLASKEKEMDLELKRMELDHKRMVSKARQRAGGGALGAVNVFE